MASAGSISKITLPSQATYDLKDAEARAALSAKSAVSVDGGRADVDIRHISKDDYEALVARGAALSNTLYLVSADYVDAYGQQIRNIQPGSALSDAASYGQVLSIAETALTAVPSEYKTYAQTILTLSADGYATSADVELSGLYGSASSSKWTCSPAQMTGEEPYSIEWVEVGMNTWNWALKGGDNSQQYPIGAGDPNAGEVTFWIPSYGIAQTEVEYVTATRIPDQYQLGSQSGKLLQAAGNYLTSVPSEYKTYAKTRQDLSTAGYAVGVKVNGEVKKAVQGSAAADRGIVDIGTVLSAVPGTYKTYSDTTTALTASSGFKTYAQTRQGLSADGYATSADTTLTHISEWVFANVPSGWHVEYDYMYVSPHYDENEGSWKAFLVADDESDYLEIFDFSSPEDATSLTFNNGTTAEFVSGYRLGPDDPSNPNRDKSLATAEQGAKADTAIQGVKLNGTALTADSGNVVNVTALTAHQAVSAVYSGQHIYLSANGARVGDIDCGDFVKDSVLSSAELCGSTLVFKFKVTSGQPQDPISVQLSSFIDDYDSDISQINQRITALSGNGVVHVTGDETAAGKKTFSDAFTVGTRKSGTYGTKSFTYGLNNLASGSGSFAGGQNCVASEAYAVAEGYQTSALGIASHAEGQITLAKNGAYCAHVEGYATIANSFAHAEGIKSVADDVGSHAEGNETSALQQYSHAEGDYTIANNEYEHAQGILNISNKGSSLSSNTIDSIGIGTSSNARKNATEVMQNGDAYFLGVGGYDGTNAVSAASKPLAAVLSAKADVDSLGYALSTAVGTLSSGSYVYDVTDRTITTIGINQSSTPVVVRLPAASTYARDFIVRIEISSAAAPSFTFANADGLTFESEDDDWAVMEPGLNIVSFTETKR